MTDPLRLDIACGQKKQEGFRGIDSAKIEGVDYVHDLNEIPWPFEDSTVSEIYCSHYVEHVVDLLSFMDEVWRICKKGALCTFITPYYTSIRAWQDPTHVRGISEATYHYFRREWRMEQQLDHYPLLCDFSIETVGVAFHPPWGEKPEAEREFAQTHYFNVISDISVTLKVRK